MAAVVSSVASPGEMAAALRRAGFGTAQIPVMVAIGLAESGGEIRQTHTNRNGSVDYGVWQINSVHGFNTESLLTLDGNASAAKTVYDRQGLHAWAVYNSGTYLQHMSNAKLGTKNVASTTGVENAIPGAGVLSDVLAPITWLIKVGQILTSADFWKRFGMVLLGAGLLAAGVNLYARTELGSGGPR